MLYTMSFFKTLIENNFTAVLILGVLAGLFLPWVDALPDYCAILLISAVIFFSCSKVAIADVRAFDVRSALLFYILRFIALPAVLYAVALITIPTYAVGVLLIALMPTGVASSAMSTITGGNNALALTATVVTNALAPLLIPVMIALCASQHIAIDTGKMLVTLCLSIFVPALLYFFGAANIAPVQNWVRVNAQCASILLIGGMATAVVAMRREYFFDEPLSAFIACMIGIALFALLYVVGWGYAWRMGLREKKTYAICSGTNNIALSAALAVIYFSPATVLLTVTGEIAWVVGVSMFKRMMRE
jgi:predicted Na+-dependent transporter